MTRIIQQSLLSILLRCVCAMAAIIASQVARPLEAADYHVIPCHHKPAAELEKLLVEILPEDPSTNVVVDSKRNQILVQGSTKTIQIAEEFVRSADRPDPRSESGPTSVKAYPCPTDLQDDIVANLQRRFASQPDVRITADRDSGKLFVLAPPSVHAFVDQLTTDALADASRVDANPQRLPATGRQRREPNQVPSQPHRRADQARFPSEQFLPLTSEVHNVQRRVVALFGRRLTQLPGGRNPMYRVKLSPVHSLDFEFDFHRCGVHVTSTQQATSQFAQLITAIDQAAQNPKQRVSVLSIERSDPKRLERAINVYRANSVPGPKAQDSSSRNFKSEVAPAAYFAQLVKDDASDEKAQTNGTSQDLNDLGVNVEVELLPELDVIILRGRDRDVDRLTRIIEELERLSERTQPEIQIYHLKHTRGESIAAIIDDISEDFIGGRQGRVTVVPLAKPNALLLIGWGEAVESVIALIQRLDTPVTPESQFAVYRLKHANALDIQQRLQQFFANREGLAPQVQAIADPRSNSLIVYAAPRDMREVNRLVESLDTASSRVVNKGRVFKIRNALASDLATTLQQAIDAAGGGTADPSAILELMTIAPEGEQLVSSGMLSGVRVTPNARNNTLIVTGPTGSMDLVAALIEQLDSPGSSAQIKVFRILNGDASSLVQLLRSLLPSESTDSTDRQLPSAEGETSLAPLRFSVDTRTNSIIATGSPGDLEIIHALLLRLDQSDATERKNSVYRLKNAPAIDVAAAINEFLRSERIVQTAAPGSTSPFEQIEREVIVVPEPIRNNLIISATPRYFDEIERLVEQLDSQPPQVIIQVLIAEVNLNQTEEFGVELGIQDSVLFDRGLLGDIFTTTNSTQTSTASGIVTSTNEVIQAATNNPGFNFNNLPLGNSGSDRALTGSNTVGGQGLSNFAVGRVNTELGFGGLVLGASSESVSVLIRALQESNRLQVLSRPQIRTLDNQPAYIQVGQRVPRVVGSTINEVGQTNTVTLENVGLIMGVTPRISPDGTVVMEIDAEKSSLGPEQQGIPISVSVDGTVIRSPRIDTTQAQATVSAASGETIILGGLITKSTEEFTRRVPLLSDIPVLGELFRYESLQNRRTELIIILTPHVIRSPDDSERIKQTEIARMSWCAADVFDMHGDIGYSIQNTSPIFDADTEIIYPDVNPRGSRSSGTMFYAPEMAAPPLGQVAQ